MSAQLSPAQSHTGPMRPHADDILDELHCKVAFISAAAWAFARLTRHDPMPESDAWQGLGFFIQDIEASLKLLRQP